MVLGADDALHGAFLFGHHHHDPDDRRWTEPGAGASCVGRTPSLVAAEGSARSAEFLHATPVAFQEQSSGL